MSIFKVFSVSASMTVNREQGSNMAQSAGTYLKAKHQLGTMKNMDDIRWTDEEKENISFGIHYLSKLEYVTSSL